MMTKVPLADVLWRAANEHLSDGYAYNSETWVPSCCAVMQVLRPKWAHSLKSLHEQAKKMPAFIFLKSLGCSTHSLALRGREDSQGVRYMWLLLAMYVDEDEQIMVEGE